MIITGTILMILGLGGLMLPYLEGNRKATPFAVLFLILGAVAMDLNSTEINLPEEIDQLKPTDTLKGYYDSKGVLHIEFNNKRNQKWKNIQ